MRPLSQEDLEHVLVHTQHVWQDLRDARLFITGGTGFFGKWLLETFQYANRQLSLHAQAIVLSRDPACFLKEMPHIADDGAIRFVQGDVASFEFPAGDISHIIHAATETTARHGRPQPLQTLETVVTGTRHVLDLTRERHVQSLLLTSSGAVYGKQPPEMTHIPEDYQGGPNPLDPNAAYGNGKRYAEQLCAVYHAEYGIPAKIARCFAFVGPHLPLDAHFAVGNFIRDGLCGRPIAVNGDGTACRSYLHAADLAIWLWTILAKGEVMRPYNVGSHEAISIGALAELVSTRFAQTYTIAQQAVPGQSPARYVPSVSRAASELSLNVNITLDDAIARTTRWLRTGSDGQE